MEFLFFQNKNQFQCEYYINHLENLQQNCKIQSIFSHSRKMNDCFKINQTSLKPILVHKIQSNMDHYHNSIDHQIKQRQFAATYQKFSHKKNKSIRNQNCVSKIDETNCQHNKSTIKQIFLEDFWHINNIQIIPVKAVKQNCLLASCLQYNINFLPF